MAVELPGKRCLCANGSGERLLEPAGISRWGWRAGVIRAAAADCPALTVCVQWDGEQCAERKWRRLKEECEVVLLEQELVWAAKKPSSNGSSSSVQEKRRLQPALKFRPLIGQSCVGGLSVVEFISDRQLEFLRREGGAATVQAGKHKHTVIQYPEAYDMKFRPLIGQSCVGGLSVVEFISDRQLEFYAEKEELQPFKDEVDGGNPAVRDDPPLQEQVQAWLKQNQFHKTLQQGGCSLKGLRVKVFRQESKTQWLSGVITHHEQNNRTVAVMTDQGLEIVNIDPSLVQMLLLDEITQSSTTGDNSKRKSHITKINRVCLSTGSITNTTTKDQVCKPVQQQTELSTNNCCMENDKKEGMREENRSDEERDSFKSKNSHCERKRKKEDEEKDDQQRNRCGLKRLKGGSVSDLSENSDSENSSCRAPDSSSDLGSKRQLKQRYISKRPLDCEIHPSHRGGELSSSQLGETETQILGKTPPSDSCSSSCNGAFRNTETFECAAGVCAGKSDEKGNGGMTEIEDRSEGTSREDSEAVSALLASQESEQLVSMETTCVLLHTSPLECEGAEGEMSMNDSQVKGSEFTHAEARRTEFNQSEVRRSDFPHSEAITNSNDIPVALEEEPRGAPSCSPVKPCNKKEDGDCKQSRSPATVNTEYEAESPCCSPETISIPQSVREVSRQKLKEGMGEIVPKEGTPLPKSMDRYLSGLKMAPNPKVTCSTTPVVIKTPSPNRSRTPTHSPSRTPNRTPTPDKSTKSPLIVDRKEPFTIYRDPALVRAELKAHPTYIQPSHTPPNSKHHHKMPSPSSGSPSLTTASSHSKLLSPSPHPAHLSPIALHSQPPLCSLSTTPHSAIPHPHLLPSLLPALSPSATLLAGHPRIGTLGLPHHPIALPGNPSLLGQTTGGAPMAPLGLYPLLWPPFPNGAHSYPGLGLQPSKWTHQDHANISDNSVRRNTPNNWLSQPSPVNNADGHGLQPPLPIRPSSADPQRASRSSQHCTPSSKTTEELDRRGIPESTFIHSHLKSDLERIRTSMGKNGQTYSPVALESPPSRTKQPLVVYDLTGDRPNSYQEENRRILLESSEVAPFTAKLGSDREHRYPRSPTPTLPSKEREIELDRDRERDMHAFRHTLPPRPQSAHPSPTLTPSSYYASLCNSVENRPPQRRVPASKELYERLSASNSVAPVLTSSSQVSMRAQPPPLVKRQHEKEEGLLGKITEQLAHKASSMDAVEMASVERRGPGSSLISVSSSSRSVPLLHRAPIFHPPAPTTVVSKDSGHGRLSPPTLTPIQPMSLSEKGQKQQRPPTLLPEFKHVALDGKRPMSEKAAMSSQAYNTQWGGVIYGREKVGGHTTNGGVVKPQVATASVIVRPTSHTHTIINYTVSDSSVSQMHCRPIRPLESMSNLKSKEGNVQHKRGVLWTPLDTVHPINMTTQKEDLSTPINMTTKPINTAHPSHGVAHPITNMNATHSKIDLIAEQCKKRDNGAIQPNMEPSPSSYCTSRDFPHLKKHRAGLAAAISRANTHTIQPQHTTYPLNAIKHTSHLSESRFESLTALTTHAACSAHVSEREKEPVLNTNTSECLASGTSSPAPTNKQGSPTNEYTAGSTITNQSAQSGQNNYHKLKKAWLTRHSEQDRGSMASQTLDGTKSAVILTTTSTYVPAKQEVNGLMDNLEDKNSFDNKKSKILKKKPTQETRKSNSNATVFCSQDKKSVKAQEKPVTTGKKSSLDNVKPVLDRNCKLEGKESIVEDKKSTEKHSNLGHMKTEREKRGEKRPLESNSDSETGGDSGNESENGESGRRFKRQPKTSFKIKQNDSQMKKVKEEEEEEEAKSNGTLQSAKDKPQRIANSNGIPRSVLKDWRKVRKLKQTGEAFLQDDSCAEIGANVQKCRECRVDRSRKAQEPALSPVFCRFYYFRRLSYSKNGVIRVDGFSVSEQTDEEAVTVWTGSTEDEDDKKRREMDLEMSKSILTFIGDQFCRLVKTEDTAYSWVKKDTQIMWKRAVRGVREMCDACEATLFNMHWACHKCGFVVCMDCYKAREKRKAKDKELYVWVRCVKNQPHDLKNLMPTQIVPDSVLEDMQNSLHSLKEKFGISSQRPGTETKSLASTNGLSPLSDTDQSDLKSRQIPDQQKNSQHVTLRAHTERRENVECDGVEAQSRKSTSPEQGSTLRDLLTSTAGKLRLGSAGGAFAPVYNFSEQVTQNIRVPNILDDIIASVVENKIPATKMAKVGFNQDSLPEEEAGQRPDEVRLDESPLANPHATAPYDWLGNHRLLWLKDHRHQGNQRLFKENWTQEQPVLVSGLHKSLNANLWKPEHFSREFSSLHSDLYNCRDGSITNSKVKEFWDGFEDASKRPKSGKGESVVYRLKDWPSGEEFLALMPARYHDVMKFLPVPEYTDPEAHLNLASHLPSFFIRPDLGPRLCCAHGVTACPEQDFGTSNLHVEISDTMSILVYVGVAKGNGASSKAGVLKLLEEEVLDESVRKRLKDPNETPGALWHVYMSKDLQKIQEFLHKVAAEQHTEADPETDSDSEWDSDADPLREGSWYLSPRLRQRLQDEYGVESRTLLQFHGDAVIIPAGALHQVMNLHSCIQVNVDFVSPEHAHNSYYLTQELRPLRDLMNYEDKLQVKNIFYHSVKDAVATLRKHLKEEITGKVKQEES
ncbi:probable JmjC domain-containing histone demethylation protein 2C [Danio aesculapii]|uniref:probable JmjC domain-containing histone demethylation protein 2C n=1 Tax=Danio aesculapii TaxID=1142201 RepID=UPI0024BF5209|nr:probable JmjC domain-containing histone demethylation protein 2C [Danio aesculapii]